MQNEPQINKRWVKDLKGKSYPLFAGVLDLAHQVGLEGIVTELLQIPTAENKNTAIVRATVRMKFGREFSSHGDASPENTAPMIAKALIRMAETRAIGRALRNATNVGDCLFEELPDLEFVQAQPAARAQR